LRGLAGGLRDVAAGGVELGVVVWEGKVLVGLEMGGGGMSLGGDVVMGDFEVVMGDWIYIW
jgi:hypothetical protein